MIQKIVHQIWWQGQNSIPKSYPNYTHKWKAMNKDFRYMFWDEDKINKLLKLYPQYKERFDSLPNMIQKIDMAKYLIMHRYGGLYVDIDAECLKPAKNLLKGKKIMLVQINVNPFEKLLAYGKTRGYALQNHIMAGQRGHPFWLHTLNVLVDEDLNQKLYETKLKYIFRTTGPGLLTKAFITYPNKKDITVVPHSIIDPLSWCDYEVNNCGKTSCAKNYPNAYSIHHYGSKHSTHSWTSSLEKDIGILFCKNKKNMSKFLPYFVFFILVLIIVLKYNRLI